MTNKDRFITFNDGINFNDIKDKLQEETPMKGHVIIRDKEGNILHEEDNLVLMRARVWLFEQLFGASAPTTYTGAKINNNRIISLFSIGSGGADINASAFTPFTPKFNDVDLGQPIPFVTIDPDKPNNSEAQANPSIVTELSAEQANTFYMPVSNPDGTTPYYTKRFKDATAEEPLGSSKKWVLDQSTGGVAFSLALSVERDEARGTLFNEIGLWLAEYDSSNNTFKDAELATRLTFQTESLASLTKGIDIEYIMYI